MPVQSIEDFGETVKVASKAQVDRFLTVRRRLSRNDIRVIVMSHAIRVLSGARTKTAALDGLRRADTSLELLIDALVRNGAGAPE
jgi:hypothetical protein